MQLLSFLEVLSTMTVATTVLQFLTGSLTCYKFAQRKSTGDASAFPFLSGFLSCSLWLQYGLLKEDRSVVIVNIIGSLLFFVYSIVFYLFSVNKKFVFYQFASICIFLLSISISIKNFGGLEFAGYVCCTITILFVAAPFSTLRHVIKVKNAESLPFPLIASTFFVSIEWFLYGFLINDLFIQIPNLIGCALSGSQLSLFIIYPSRSAAGPGPSYKLLHA